MSVFSGFKNSLNLVIDKGDSDSISRAIGNIKSSLKLTPSILAKELSINGDIISSGVIEIEGAIKGNIKGNSVVIRESGVVDGEIKASSVSVYGKFNGLMESDVISIFSKARVVGTISYKSLSVEDGALIDGQFKQLSKKP